MMLCSAIMMLAASLSVQDIDVRRGPGAGVVSTPTLTLSICHFASHTLLGKPRVLVQVLHAVGGKSVLL